MKSHKDLEVGICSRKSASDIDIYYRRKNDICNNYLNSNSIYNGTPYESAIHWLDSEKKIDSLSTDEM